MYFLNDEGTLPWMVWFLGGLSRDAISVDIFCSVYRHMMW